MEFTKMHGLGNDFILVLSPQLPTDDLSSLAKKVCNRHTGIGGDGLLCLFPSKQAHIRMRIINADGSEPEQCGNAIRCLAKYAYERGIVPQTEMNVETQAGIQTVWLTVKDGQVLAIRVDMGRPILEAAQVPVKGEGRQINTRVEVGNQSFRYTAVSMGNPHMVIEVEDVIHFPIETYGHALEHHPDYPEKTNVEFITIQSPKEITMRVWERGVGPTMACGTGACATAVAGVLLEKTHRTVVVRLPGGDLTIDWSAENDHVYMTGPAEDVFSGKWLSQLRSARGVIANG